MARKFKVFAECVGQEEVAEFASILGKQKVDFKAVWTARMYTIYIDKAADEKTLYKLYFNK